MIKEFSLGSFLKLEKIWGWDDLLTINVTSKVFSSTKDIFLLEDVLHEHEGTGNQVGGGRVMSSSLLEGILKQD